VKPVSVYRQYLYSLCLIDVEEVSERRNKVGDAPDIQTRCVAIHEAIKAMPDLDLSNPSTFTTLPFPSFLPMPTQRFERKNVNDMHHFEYMGRHPFGELHKCIQDENFLIGGESLYCTGRPVLGSLISSLRLRITLFVKEGASSIFRTAILFYCGRKRQCGWR